MSVAPSSFATSLDRRIQMLRTAMGPLIAAALEDPDVVEVMLNPDRTLWVDRLSSGRAPMGVELPEADGERIIRLVAAHVGAEVHRGQPLLSAELPETGERFASFRYDARGRILESRVFGAPNHVTTVCYDSQSQATVTTADNEQAVRAGRYRVGRQGLGGYDIHDPLLLHHGRQKGINIHRRASAG